MEVRVWAGFVSRSIDLKSRKKAIYDEPDTNKQKNMRNELQNQIIRLSDNACDVYLRGIVKFDATRKLFFNSVSIIAGGVAPLFGDGTTESLAVASGLATAANAEITATVFQQQAVNLVENAITNSRKSRADEIIELQKKNIADYGVEAALRDVGKYHQLCALRRGLEFLASKSATAAPSKTLLNDKLGKVEEKIAAARTALAGTSAVAALTGDRKERTKDDLQALLVEQARIKALLPYAL